MASDPWPDEPDEPDPEARWGDPEARWGDPERDLEKRVRIPEVSIPEPSGGSADPELSRAFWASVLFVNAAVFMLSLGPLLVIFRGRWTLGLGLVAGGVLLLGRTYQLYQSTVGRSGDADADTDADSTDADGDAEVAAETDTDTDDDSPERNP